MNLLNQKRKQNQEYKMDIVSNAMKDYGLSPLPHDTVEAMAYVPFQQLGSTLYAPAQALESGTVYPILDKPFFGKKCGGKNA